MQAGATLLDFYASTSFFQLSLQLVGLFPLDALLDGLRGLVDQRLGLLQAEAGGRPDDLDHLDLLVAGARQDDVEGGLLLGGTARAVSAGGGSRRSGRGNGGRRDAELLLERLDALGQLHHRDRLELVDPFLCRSHGYSASFSSGCCSSFSSGCCWFSLDCSS